MSGRHPDEREVAPALADDLVAGGDRDQVGEALQGDRVAVVDELRDRVVERRDDGHAAARSGLTHRCCGPRNEMFGWNGSSWPGTRPRPGKRSRQLLERERRLEPAEAAPRQKWMPLPNARWRRAFVRSRSNASRVVEALGVAAGGGEPEEAASRPRAGRRRRASSAFVVTRRQHRDRRVVAQRLLDGAGDQRRVGDEPVPARRVLEQPAHRVADQVVRRLVAGERQREQDRGDLLVGQRVGVLVVDREQRAREVVAALPSPCAATRPRR